MIGLFDSGSGGLTVLDACRKACPNEDFLYLGDHANAPYGHRSNQQILDLTREGVNALFNAGCHLVILACNTAAAVALRTLQQEWLKDNWPDRNILGVLVPMVEEVTGVPWQREDPTQESADDGRIIGLFATTKTVESRAYAEELEKRAPQLVLHQKACPGLVDAIEAGVGPAPMRGLISGYAHELKEQTQGHPLDAVVLGCTHFPLVRDYFEEALGADVPVYCQASVVAEALAAYLIAHPEFSDQKSGGSMRLLTSGNPMNLTPMSGYLPTVYSEFEKLD